MTAWGTLSAQSAPNSGKRLNLYLDCRNCDLDYFQEEIPYVNHVRDLHDADVQVLFSQVKTGGGGERWTLVFLGRGKYDGYRDSLDFSLQVGESNDELRKQTLHYLRLGLVPLLLHSDVAPRLKVEYESATQGSNQTQQAVTDPWRGWIFTNRLGFFANGQETTTSFNWWVGLKAQRVTDKWKIVFTINGSENGNTFTYGDSTIKSYSNRRNTSLKVVGSLGNHWAWMLKTGYYSSSYDNIESDFYFKQGVEYNFFPYSEATHQQLKVSYSIDQAFYRYLQETIFFKTEELLLRGSLLLSSDFTQSWGSGSIFLGFSHYFHDFTKRSFSLGGQLSFHLIKGLSLQVAGNFASIHDQLTLPKTGASYEEVLLQRKELATQYRYFSMVGLSYTFGSIYNSVVNTRFDNDRGMRISVSM